VHTTEKTLKDAGDKIPADDKKLVEDALAQLKDAIPGGDAAAIRQKTDALQEVAMKLGEHLYRSEQEEGMGAAAAPEADKGDDSNNDKAKEGDIVDAEYTEVDDDGKKQSKQ